MRAEQLLVRWSLTRKCSTSRLKARPGPSTWTLGKAARTAGTWVCPASLGVGTRPHSHRPQLQPETPHLLCVAECCGSNGGSPKVTSTGWGQNVTWFGEKGLCSFPGVGAPAAKDSFSGASHERSLCYLQKLRAQHSATALGGGGHDQHGGQPRLQGLPGRRTFSSDPASGRQTSTNSSSSLQPPEEVCLKVP